MLVASHPTRGVDVGAQAAIWDVIKDARRAGLGVLLISADLDELIGLSDTLHVMYGGRIVATLDPADGHACATRFVHDRCRRSGPWLSMPTPRRSIGSSSGSDRA